MSTVVCVGLKGSNAFLDLDDFEIAKILKVGGTTDDKQSKFLFIKCLRDMIRIRSQRCNFVIVQVRLSTCHPSRDELWQASSITFTRQTSCERFTSQGGSEMSLWHILDTMHCYWYIKEIAHSWCLIQRIHTYYQNIWSFCFQIHFSDFFFFLLHCSWAWKKAADVWLNETLSGG